MDDEDQLLDFSEDDSPGSRRREVTEGGRRGVAAASSGPAATETEVLSVSRSRTLWVSSVQTEQNVESKLKSHFSRFGEVASVECDAANGEAFVIFVDTAGAERAFVNKAPVFKDSSILVNRVPDHEMSGRAEALRNSVRAPYRVYKKKEMDENGESEKLVKGGEESLYSNLDAPVKTAAPKGASSMSSSLSGTDGRKKGEKRSWSRSGVANMNNREVLKARIKEKQAQRQHALAKDQVDQLMHEISKQKEELASLMKNPQSIGKNLISELGQNLNLLSAQLRNAQKTMANAKESVARSKKAVQDAIEKSKS